MSDVSEAPPRAANTEKARQLQGSRIWYELMTTDAEAAKEFYGSIVGWNIGEASPEFGGYRMINRSDGGMAGGVLPLTSEMCDHGAKPAWLGYIGVDDVDAAIAQIEAKGGKSLMPAQDIPQVGRIAMVADPQGNPFYVMTPTPPPGDENKESDVFSVDQEQRVGWNELSTPDPVAARLFYGELFGWTSDDFMPMGEYGEYRFFDHGSTRIGAVSGIASGDQPGWRYYIRVASIPKSIEAVNAGGGTVALGPMEVPGGDHIIVGRDPQGAEFALVGK